MTRNLFYLLAFLATIPSLAQENPAMRKYASHVNAEQLKDNLTILASDALEGRYTGSRGQKMAAAFIANYFEENGLEPPVNGSYFQPVPLYSIKQGDVYLVAGTNRFENFKDLFYVGDGETGAEIKAELVYAGKGGDADLAQLDIKGKAVLLLIDNLNFSTTRALQTNARKIRETGVKYIFAVAGSTSEEFDQASARAKSRQARGDLSLDKPAADEADQGIFYLKPTAVEKIFNTTMEKMKSLAGTEPTKKPLRKIKPAVVSFQTTLSTNPVRSENVLGYLPGTDKKDELVIITAHYDHIGKRSSAGDDVINNGADDDGSGTVAVMQLAKAFAEARKAGSGPRRSMLFMTVTGEEEGLLGSEYYTKNPVFPLASTVVNLNMDMIGRTDEKYKDNKNYVYVIGADKLSSELHEMNERLNSTYTHLIFDYVYNDQNHPERLYYRSDHWNFAKNNIPIIFYFDGIHEDYHKVSDEVSKIDFDLLALRAQCVFYTAWEIANRDDRLKVDKK